MTPREQAPLRAQAIGVVALSLFLANLGETWALLHDPADLNALGVWLVSVAIAAVTLGLCALLYWARTNQLYRWVAAGGFGIMLLGSVVLSFTGHFVTLLIGLAAYCFLLFLPPSRTETPDDGPMLRAR
jgi:hypothetical protein